MRLLGILESREERRPSLGICIPEHNSKKRETIKANHRKAVTVDKDNPTGELLKTKSGTFRVNGSYRVLDTLMLSGVVEEGLIRKRMKSQKDGRDVRVTDVRRGNDVVENLLEGEEGTIFISSEIAPILSRDDLLRFKG